MLCLLRSETRELQSGHDAQNYEKDAPHDEEGQRNYVGADQAAIAVQDDPGVYGAYNYASHTDQGADQGGGGWTTQVAPTASQAALGEALSDDSEYEPLFVDQHKSPPASATGANVDGNTYPRARDPTPFPTMQPPASETPSGTSPNPTIRMPGPPKPQDNDFI